MIETSSDEVLRRYLNGLLNSTEELEVARHVEQNPGCLDILDKLSREPNIGILRSVKESLVGDDTKELRKGVQSVKKLLDIEEQRIPAVIGEYQIERVISSGATATVCLATNLKTYEDVVVKILSPFAASIQ